MEEFPNLIPDFVENICRILMGDLVSHIIQHTWTTDSVNYRCEVFVMRSLDPYYSIYYINDEHLDKDYDFDKYEFGANYIMQGLT